MFKNIRNNKYLLPGLKRWLSVLILGTIFIIFGVALLLELSPLYRISTFIWEIVHSIATLIPPQVSGPAILILGIICVALGVYYSIRTTVSAAQSDPANSIEHDDILRSLERAYKKGTGPKIVTLGGGTGLSTLLKGLKSYSRNITAIVTVGDDGGSSGKLREELKVIPPGDIRNCIVALADEDEILGDIFQYRFNSGTLKGHSLGNLFLVALADLYKNFHKASQMASRILRSSGQVLPASEEPLHLVAKYDDGSIVEGESVIPCPNRRIKEIYNQYSMPKALPSSIKAIKNADLIIMGPGSLYTSVLPNMLFPEIVDAIKASKSKKLYIANLTEDSETKSYTVNDCLQAIHDHTDTDLIDAVLINDTSKWTIEDKKPIQYDLPKILEMNIEYILRSKLFTKDGQHNSSRLGRCIYQWFLQSSRS